MSEQNYYEIILIRLLKDIYSNKLLRTSLGFKGGTAEFFFYDLPRFSTDLDFDILNSNNKQIVFQEIKKIFSRFGTITELTENKNTIFLLTSNKKNTRKIKIEISEKNSESHFEPKNYLGIPMLTMKKEDMAANKLLALLTRKKFAARDLFDLWYFLNNDWEINEKIIKKEIKINLKSALEKTLNKIKNIRASTLVYGLGDLTDEEQKTFVKNELKNDLMFNINLYLNKLN
jgi:predicted nucleotidyltransferase component of viral defense system